MALCGIRRTLPNLDEWTHHIIFLNGINPNQSMAFHKLAEETPFLLIKSNWTNIVERLAEFETEIGDWYQTTEGNREFREGLYEGCGEIWTRELAGLKEYHSVVLVDADCEILDFSIIEDLLRPINDNPNVAVSSAEFSVEEEILDTYSNRMLVLAQRHHTFLCTYQMKALDLFSDFSVLETAGRKFPVFFDHSAFLQKKLEQDFSFELTTLGGKCREKYLHYGAFAKNRTFHGIRLNLYRFMKIGSHNGFMHVIRLPRISLFVRIAFQIVNRAIFLHRFDRERTTYLFQSRKRET